MRAHYEKELVQMKTIEPLDQPVQLWKRKGLWFNSSKARTEQKNNTIQKCNQTITKSNKGSYTRVLWQGTIYKIPSVKPKGRAY